MRQTLRIVLAGSVLGLGLGLGGCWYPGYYPEGNMASRDIHTIPSTPNAPMNVSVIDWTTN